MSAKAASALRRAADALDAAEMKELFWKAADKMSVKRAERAEANYTALVSHLQGPTGWVIDEPGKYEIFIRVFQDGSGFVTSLERQELDAPSSPDDPYPSHKWRTFHELCARAERAEAQAARMHTHFCKDSCPFCRKVFPAGEAIREPEETPARPEPSEPIPG